MSVTTATKFRILAADKLSDQGLAYIRAQADAELTVKTGMTEADLARIIGRYDALIVRSGVQVTAEVLAEPGDLKIVARAGVGVDNIDLDAATAKGVLVVNSAEASTLTTAEHALALLFALARNIGPAYKSMTEGQWDRNRFQGRQLAGKTLGIVGFGRIGRTVAERALAMGMTVLAYDPFINATTAMDGKVRLFSDFEELLPHSDVLTFHVPLNERTQGMLNRSTFARCRKGVLVVNAARGGIVSETDLLAALDSGACGGAALDVFTDEPLPADSPLRKHPRILLTPHLGASTLEAQEAVAIDAAQSVMTYLRGEGVRGAVNAPGVRLDLDPLQSTFVDLAQRMARLISPMITRGIASVSFAHSGPELAAAAPTIERMGTVGLLQGHFDVPLNLVNVLHVAEQRGIHLRTTSVAERFEKGPQLTIEVQSPASPDGTVQTRRIVGRVYHDNRPRVIEINGYHMDMIPAGVMLLIQNQDRPGMVGLVGTELGQAQVNIADMAISRRRDTALMVLKLDNHPPESLLDHLRGREGILQIAVVKLPPERG